MLRQAFWIAWKDIQLDFRQPREILGLITLGLVCLFIFGFALGVGTPSPASLFLPYWMALLFLTLLSTLWIFEREQQNGTLQALLLACREPSSIYLGKLLAYSLRHAVIQFVLMVVFLTIHNRLTPHLFVWFGLVNAMTLLGFTALGVLTAALLTGAGVAGTLGGVLLFPLLIPVVLGAVSAMERAVGGASATPGNWLELLAAADVLFVAFPVIIFDKILEN
ncbi:MAG: heme exporter protein CcmB [Nitrospirae bacterium]|nr:heme exporter protein CcmB [Nitrospirota bacterium]